jgi:hypothetical protein
MIRQKFPSAIGSDAPTGRAAKISVQLMTVSLRAIPNCARRQRFSLRQAGPRQSETVFSRSRVVLSHALAKRPARQVLPCGRQKTPPKYLKNKKNLRLDLFCASFNASRAVRLADTALGLESGDELRA